MRNRSPFIVSAIVLAIVLAGCGNDDDHGTTSTATATAVAATATATVQSTATAAPTGTSTPPPTATPPPTGTATAQPTSTETAPPTATATASLVDELTAAGLGRYLDDSTPAETVPNGAWESLRFDPADAKAICLRGDPYRVEVHHGSSNKVLLYLEGGGACPSIGTDATTGVWTAARVS